MLNNISEGIHLCLTPFLFLSNMARSTLVLASCFSDSYIFPYVFSNSISVLWGIWSKTCSKSYKRIPLLFKTFLSWYLETENYLPSIAFSRNSAVLTLDSMYCKLDFEQFLTIYVSKCILEQIKNAKYLTHVKSVEFSLEMCSSWGKWW